MTNHKTKINTKLILVFKFAGMPCPIGEFGYSVVKLIRIWILPVARDGHCPQFLVAVDGGATGTRVRVCDAAGRPLGEGRAGPSSLTLGVPAAWESVLAAMRAAFAAAGAGAPEGGAIRLAAGLAGALCAENRAAFREHSPLSGAELTIVTDGYASLIGAFAGAPGVAVAVGTGVTAYALHPGGEVVQASGWGFPVGDEGGGAWIGHRALQAYLKWRDGRRTAPSRLFETLPERLGASLGDIQAWLRKARSTEYAALAPLVVAAAADRDALAEEILREGAAEIAETIDAIDVSTAGLPIALLGGLAEVFGPRLPERHRARLVAPRGNALDGLVRLLLDRSMRSGGAS